MDEYEIISRSAFMRIMFWLALILLIVSFALPVIFWSDLSDTVPRHFDAAGQPDRWGGKVDILLFPFAAIFVILLFLYRHEEKNPRQYFHSHLSLSLVRLWIVCVLAYSEWKAIQISMGKTNEIGMVFMAAALISLAMIVLYTVVSLYVTDNNNDWA